MSRLGVYWSVWHRRQSDYDYFKALQPSVFKIMDGGDVDYTFAKDNLPNSLVIARDWALSEQHDDLLRDPVGTGQRHAREWNDHQHRLGFDRAKTLILGINEPRVWDAGVPEALRQYTIAMCYEAMKFGLRVGAMQLSVGWPGNSGEGQPPDWSPFYDVDQAILHNGGALITHEYWADQGPAENWGWWGGRTLRCPWQVPIVIGECGVDMFVKDTSGGQQNRGWVGHMPPERYAAELAEYTNRMSADPRFVGCCVFASDYAAQEWYSFDIEPAYAAILAQPISGTPTPPLPVPPLPTTPPVVPPVHGGLVHPLPDSILTQHWGENGGDYARFGIWGHNGTDLGGRPLRTPVRAMSDGVVAYSDFDEGYGYYVRLDHLDGECYSFYAHLDEAGAPIASVLAAGDTLGLLGSSGNSSGPHLHLEIRLQNTDGTYKAGTPMLKGRVDPETWCILHGLKL